MSGKNENIDIPIYQKMNLTVEEAAAYSGIGMGRIRTMLKNPRCPFLLCIGRRTLVKRKEFEKYVSDRVEL